MQTILFLLKNHGKLWYLMLFILVIKYHGLILISGLKVLILRGGEIISTPLNPRNNPWFEIKIRLRYCLFSINESKR